MTSLRLSILLAAGLGLPAFGQDGLTLFQPFDSSTTYLVDGAGMVANSWAGPATPALSVYLLPDGDLLRTLRLTTGGGGTGGGIERVGYGGTVEWQLTLFSPTQTPHHDIEILPNGNVLMIVWEEVGGAAAIAQGRDPQITGSLFTPDAIYEIAPTGPVSGAIVWEWRAMDHLVQDFNASLPGFGVVADHPELIDINKGDDRDWMHTNGIDYNETLDQIVLSVPNYDEVWIIDHSTTTAEAASHSGGTSGRGGDLLYRWGNPAAYNRGTSADQIFYFIHDVNWIEEGKPGEGNLLVFNNGRARPTGDWSSADEWVPPVDLSGNYSIAPGAAFGPSALTWTYSDPPNFFTNIMGGAERLENGNTLICEATAGRIFEVTPSGAIVWTFVNPFGGLNWVFKARRYADCDSDGIYDREEITNQGGDANNNDALDSCESPVNYCTAVQNSSGGAASMGWSGTTSLTANDLTLRATSCPPNVFGLFAFSNAQQATPLGDGTLCLAGTISRFPVVATNSSGLATYAVDNQNLASTAVAWNPSSVRNFSFWFRDTTGGPAGFNFSDGLSVLLVQ